MAVYGTLLSKGYNNFNPESGIDSFMNEFNDFSSLVDAVGIMTESGSLQAVQESVFKDIGSKVKEFINKFVAWIKKMIKMIKDKIASIFKKKSDSSNDKDREVKGWNISNFLVLPSKNIGDGIYEGVSTFYEFQELTNMMFSEQLKEKNKVKRDYQNNELEAMGRRLEETMNKIETIESKFEKIDEDTKKELNTFNGKIKSVEENLESKAETTKVSTVKGYIEKCKSEGAKIDKDINKFESINDKFVKGVNKLASYIFLSGETPDGTSTGTYRETAACIKEFRNITYKIVDLSKDYVQALHRSASLVERVSNLNKKSVYGSSSNSAA